MTNVIETGIERWANMLDYPADGWHGVSKVRTMIGRVGPAMTRIVALGISALAGCSAAGAAELREVHIDVGSSQAPLIATVHVEDYRAAPVELLAPAVTGDARMTRFMKTYYEVGRAGDTKGFASLFAPEVGVDTSDDHPSAPQALKDDFSHLRSVRMLAVLHWGEYQVGLVAYEAVDGGDTRKWSASHAARCVGDSCQIPGYFENSLLARIVVTAFDNKGTAQLAVPAQGETLLPILPAVADATRQAAVTEPIVLHLNRSSDQTTLAASRVVSSLTDKMRATSPKQPTFENLAALYSAGTPSKVDVFQRGNEASGVAYSDYVTWFADHAPWTVSSVYSFGPDVCLALLKADKDRALHWLPLQRAGDGWKIISDPSSSLDAWHVVSSGSTYQALQSR